MDIDNNMNVIRMEDRDMAGQSSRRRARNPLGLSLLAAEIQKCLKSRCTQSGLSSVRVNCVAVVSTSKQT